jgi:hypothetical protein
LFNYPRHLVLLGSLTAALAIAGPGGSTGIGGRFARYGALPAAALALCIAGGARPSPPRRLFFVAAAAVLSLATARLGLFGMQAARALGGSGGPVAILASCAALGALSYGALIRVVLEDPGHPGARLGTRPLIVISIGCATATALALAVSRGLHTAGILWLVVSWWFAFSGGLWYADASESHKMPV